MQHQYRTTRLLLDKLSPGDADFIFSLVNTDGWLQFIGDRNVRTKDAASAYIRKIMDNPAILYWVVKLQDTQTPVGIITFIQRDYLDHSDIGFAFLPAYNGKGYATEASSVVLNDALNNAKHSTVLATTIPENKKSIQLLEKLGFHFTKEITNQKDLLLLYAITRDKFAITKSL
jgi:RimJ/RimL family protein N-acetyltransferase